jgi:diacylglycerol O-acyltransferase / wax synthase
MERLSPLDASFLHIESDGVSLMHIASLAVFEGPVPPYEKLRDLVGSKLPQLPRYRQRVRMLPGSLGRPVWVDDPHFNLDYHVRHTALAHPGGDEQVRRLVGRIMSQQLDRDRPLWESWIVEGLEDGHWAMINKVHHAMVDGVSGTDLLTVLLDDSPDAPAYPPVPWRPQPEPSTARILARAVADRSVQPYEQMRSLRALARTPRRGAKAAAATAQGVLSYAGLALPGHGATSLNGPIGPHRRWTWARGTVADAKEVKSALGGTLNDVVLTAVSGGFRALLLSRGEDVENRVVRSLVPVSVRPPGAVSSYDNRVSAMFASLPVGVADPVERLAVVSEQLQHLKHSHQAVAGEALTSMSGFAPPMLLALGTRMAFKVPQRNVQTVTTNVPGPQQPLYALGRRMLEAFPYVPLAGRVRIGVAIISYAGGLNIGVTGDFDSSPDIDVLATGIEDTMSQLLKAARERSPA